MKTIETTLATVLLAFCMLANEPSTNADYVAGESSQALLTPELRAMASQMFGANADALLHAIELNMAKYDMDMRTQSGRKNWHGTMIREEVDTNALCKVETYKNEQTGAVWRYKLPYQPTPASVKTYAPPKIGTNGVPEKLAAARAARNAQLEEGTKTVTVEITAN